MMVSSAVDKNSANAFPAVGGFAHSPISWSGRQPPQYFRLPKEVLEGVVAVSKSASAGAISEEEANELIAMLISMWLGTSVSQTVGSYLERDLAQALNDIQAWGENHDDRE